MMENFFIGIAPVLVFLALIVVSLVRSIADQYGYKFFIAPVSAAALVCSWVFYWITKGHA